MQIQVNHKTAFVATLGHELDKSLPSAVFIHGAGLDHTVWTLFIRYFVRHGRNVLALDLPGHGRSAGPPLNRIEDMADWVADVITAAGVDQAAIVGHSMGSLVALETVLRHPARARSLALIGISAPMPVHERLLAAANADNHAAADMLTIWGHSHAAQVGGVGVPGTWKTAGSLRLLERAAPGVIYADLEACNDYPDGPERAARVECPTLVIIGERDIMTPAKAGKSIGAAIANAHTVVIENCGHALLAEQPNRVLDALIEIV